MAGTNYFGKPTMSRVDGHAKVTGAAKYAAEHNVPGLAYGFVVTSAIAKGRVRRIHTTDAMAVLGVLVGGLVIAMYLPIFNLGKVV